MLIDLNEVLKRDGKTMQAEAVPGLRRVVTREGTFPITEAAPFLLRLDHLGERKVQITGDTDITVCIPCSRCLEDVSVRIPLHIEKEADMGQSETDRIQALDEQSYIEGYNLDVDKLVYSELLVNWPSKVLCRDDCKGICSICGINLNHGACGCKKDSDPENAELDPRMAKFQEIFNKFKEV